MAAARPANRNAPVDEISTRPAGLTNKKGNLGTAVRLNANYFTLVSKPDWCLYRYRVDIAPEEERTYVRKKLLWKHRANFGGYLFDGTVLYVSHQLKKLELQTIRDEDQQPMKITFRMVGDVVQGDFHYYQVFNMIVRKSLEHLQLQLVGRNYFDATNRVLIEEYQLELWPGYVTSIRQHEHSILMCAEISHKVMRDQTLYDILNDVYRQNRRNWQHAYKNQIAGCVVLTDYNNRTYKVNDVDYAMHPGMKFRLRDGTEITYASYYEQKYQIRIKNMSQPLLVSKSRSRDRRAGNDEIVYLIPELCRSTGLTEDMRANFSMMKKLAEHTRLAPGSRMQRLLDFNRRLKSKDQIRSEFKEWDFDLSSNLVEFTGRVLPQEQVFFAQGRTVMTDKDAQWNFKLQDYPQLKVGRLTDWIAVVPRRNTSAAMSFIENMITASRRIGICMSRPQLFEIEDDRIDRYVEKLTKITDKHRPQMMFCVVSTNQAMRYAAIKKKLCIDRPIPSQVIIARTLVQKTTSMLNAIGCKVATQLNCKLGGIPWTVKLSSNLPGLMVVGFDVCHDKTAKSSFGAMVASLDQDYGRYFSVVKKHVQNVELSDEVSMQLGQAVEEFGRENQGKLPSNIFFYRDGVGEGQLPIVHDHEIQAIKRELAKSYGRRNLKYKLTFIIVTKRINTRFFYNHGNPNPGTVVDDVVTDPLKYDFFIVSQSVRQGTVSPTAYNVLECGEKVSTNALQMITYKLCHLYFNFSGTVRVPAPCQYAHRLALFASQTLQQSPHQSLQKTFYYL